MMESLHLPNDLRWEGKIEPLSPSQLACTSFEEYELFEENFANDLPFSSDNEIITIKSISTCEKLQELILLANAAAEECNNDQWLNEKDIPFLNDYTTENVGFYHPIQQIKNPNTEDLMKEFELVYDAVEFTHLTPPQTPPEIHNKFSCDEEDESDVLSLFAVQEINNICHQENFNKVHQLQQLQELQQQSFIAIAAEQQQQPAVTTTTPTTFNDDLAYELEVVDELVRTRAQDLSDWNDDDSFGVFSPSSLSLLSPRSDTSSSSSSSSSCESNESKHSQDDDEWYPTTATTTSSSTKTTKRKTKSRSNDDRKSRKKEQNKNAATRYRQKKKAEVEVILGEEQVLHNINKRLQMKHNDLKREIKYLKSLMRELYTAKGVL